MKKCTKCKEEKELTEFNNDKTTKDGYCHKCKQCRKKYNNLNKDKISLQHKEHYKNNKEEHNNRVKKYYYDNQQELIQYHRNHFNKDKDKHHLICKKWREKNKKPKKEFLTRDEKHLQSKLRMLVKCAIKLNLKNTQAIRLMGCTSQECRDHIEYQLKPEMKWSNYGEVWEIDHIIPCNSFNLLDVEEQEKCFHYTNLQPLFKTTKIAQSFGYINEIGNRNKSKHSHNNNVLDT